MSHVPVDAHQILCANMIDLMDLMPLGDNHCSSHINTEIISNNHKLSCKLQQLNDKSQRLNRTDKSRLLQSPSETRKCLPMDGCEVVELITRKKKQKQKQIQDGRRRSAKCSHHNNTLSTSNMSLKHFNSALVLIIISLYTISLLNCCINQIKLANAGELPIELNVDNKVIQIHRMSNMMKQEQQNNHLSLPLNLVHNDDGDSASDVGTSESTNTDESSNDNYESDNSTQIPFDNDDSIYSNSNNNNNNNKNNNTQTTTRRPSQGAPTTTTSATIQAAGAIKQRSSASSMRITEIDLLPFSEFTVQQPAFSDLMRSWPPTTLQTTIAAADSANKRVLARQQLRGGQQQQQHFEQGGGQMGAGNGYRGAPNRHQQHHSLQQQQRQFELDHAQLESFASVLQRNHLNEDFDDTVVTADQSFESDELAEPPTWINYLGEWGDYIYFQLQQYLDNNNNNKASNNDNEQQQSADSSNNNNNNNNNNETVTSALQQLKIESIDELLDDYYYDQYENSQVLYYGPQLVREGDIFEIGCFMPNDQQAEWSKSGKPLLADKIQPGGSPRVIRRSDFLGAKQNFSLKIFEASLNDGGNYRCNKMSRKYHKLVVVPLKARTSQLYHIQQRLLSVVNPGLMSSQYTSSMTPIGGRTPSTRPSAKHHFQSTSSAGSRQLSKAPQGRNQLVPGYLIMENRPLVVNCHIADEQVLRSLRENPQFKLKWYKNGKQLRGYYALPTASNHLLSQTNNNNNNQATTGNSRRNEQYSRGRSAQQQQQQQQQQKQQQDLQQSSSSASFTSTLGVISPQSRPVGNNQRIQFLQANGRQLYISGAQYSDAGDYSCLWSGLGQAGDFDARNSNSNGNSNNNNQEQESAPSSNILGDGSLVQLLAPVKLRPFKSTYNVRQGNQLRLICLAQRGHPAAHISWYVGNRLVDNEFLREHPDEFRIIQASGAVGGQQHARSQVIVTSSPQSGAAGAAGGDYGSNGDPKRRIVEVNPVPASRQQMQMTANGRGQWIEYRDFRNDKYAIETGEQQSKYLQLKLAQLTGPSTSPSSIVGVGGAGNGQVIVGSDKDQLASSLLGQTSISVLVINSLNLDKHTSRYACRATTRANTDEVTTVIRVQAANTVSLRPASGRATLIPGQALHFQCQQLENKEAQFLWYLRPVDSDKEQQLDPNNDESFEIHNDRLTIRNPKVSSVGDYICRVKDDESNEFAIIKLRTMPYIEDFGLETSHTGRSSSVVDGGRLELNCTIRDTRAPVNITWLRSLTPDDDRSMIPITEVASSTELATDADMPTYWSPDSVVAESMGTHSKRLIIESVRPEHRSFYVCMADNGVTERTKKVIFIRVKDRLNALWPFLGIVAELFILFIIIHVWETQRAYKEITAAPLVAQTGGGGGASSKRPASGISVPFENVPLTAS